MKIRTRAAAATAACMLFMAAGNAMAFTQHVVSAHTGGSGIMSFDRSGEDSWLVHADYDQLVEFSVVPMDRAGDFLLLFKDGSLTYWDTYEGQLGGSELAKATVRFTVEAGRSATLDLAIFFPQCDDLCTNRGAWEIKAISAVPEPATYALMFAGLAAVGVAARRRSA